MTRREQRELAERLGLTILRADAVNPSHVDVQFFGLGVLRAFSITECCVEGEFTDSAGECLVWTFPRGERLFYFEETRRWGGLPSGAGK